ncbi:MAG: apolipoprotein N-acyltransferase [Sphaerochaeta sp.]
MIDLYSTRNLRTVCSEVLLLILSAFVFSLAFPGFATYEGISILAFVALIPMFAVIHNTKWSLTPSYGFLYGAVFYLFFNYWLKTFHPLAIVIVPIIKGAEMMVLFFVLKFVDKYFKKRSYLLMAVVYTAYTYLAQNWFAGYPYGTLGYASYNLLPFIQIADITGIWGINFIMVLPQILIGTYLGEYLKDNSYSFKKFIKEYKIDSIAYVALLVIVLIYGFISMHKWDNEEPQKEWRVATVQHSADTWKGGFITYKRNFNNLRVYSLEALTQNPDIVLWSETAFVPSVAWHENYPSDEDTSELVEEFVDFGKELSVPLVTGNPEGVIKDPSLPALLDNGDWNRDDYNSVIFFEDGEIKNTYRKQHLVPFTEYFPYEKQLPWLYKILKDNDYHWWLQGDDPVVFTTDEGIKFSTPICFEDVFGEISADFVQNGANVLLNMTNDGWAKSSESEMQHAAIAVFRSVENKRTTMRSTNSGITCMIDVNGRIIDPMTPFKAGWKIYNVPVYTTEAEGLTFYTKHPNLFGIIAADISYVAVGLMALYKIIEFFKKKKYKKSGK